MRIYDKQMDLEKKYNCSNSQPCLSMSSCILFHYYSLYAFFPTAWLYAPKETHIFSAWNRASVASNLIGIYRSQYYETH